MSFGVATLRALVHTGDKTSGDARSWYMINGDAKSWVCDRSAYIHCELLTKFLATKITTTAANAAAELTAGPGLAKPVTIVSDATVVGMLANPKESDFIHDYWDYFHSQQVNSTNQEAGTKQMKSRLSTPQTYVSSSVYMYEIGTVGLSDHAVRLEVVQKHIQIAVSHGSIFKLLQNAHIQAFENPSATVRYWDVIKDYMQRLSPLGSAMRHYSSATKQ
ncbi:hypothetical protein Tco_1271696, partial [Tanacetum coccineum]